MSKKKSINKIPSISQQDKQFEHHKGFFSSVQHYPNIMNSPINVFVVDAIMGKGKTSAAIKFINDSPISTHFIYITPFLTEVKRVKDACKLKKFFEPSNCNQDGSKHTDFIELLSKGKNIISTHSLFTSFNEEMIDIARLNNYVLIMDEVADVISPLNITKQDLDNIISISKYAHVDSVSKMLVWDDMNYNGKYNDYKNLALLKSVYVYQDSAFLWTFPVSIFQAFSKVFILTYKFIGQLQCYYYQFFKVDFNYIHVIENNDELDYNRKYQFEDVPYDSPQFIESNYYKNLITIYNGNLNDIGGIVSFGSVDNKQRSALSKTWYSEHLKDDFYLKKLSNNTYNFFQNIIKSKSQDNMWTTFSTFKPYIKGKGFTKGFVPCNARATNDYADRIALAYLVNRYINPVIKNFFVANNVIVNEDEFALSEMLQWIFRSRIRKGQEIFIYLPSIRMRELLENWLNS